MFTNPHLVCSIPEGRAAGELGWGEGLSSCPVDFGIDLNGDIWILDVGNQRLKKFDATGEFLLEWMPDEPDSIGPVSASRLEFDSAGNIYVIVRQREPGKRSWKLVKLNYDGEELDGTLFENVFRTDFLFRVTGSGTKFVFDGVDCVQLDASIGKQTVHHLLTDPFTDLILTGNSDADAARRGELELFPGPPVIPGSGKAIAIERPDRYRDSLGIVTAFDSHSTIFILGASEKFNDRMEVYDFEGKYLGLVPDCPKLPGVPRPGDNFLTDRDGNLYQMVVKPTWGRDTEEPFVNIWKWDSID